LDHYLARKEANANATDEITPPVTKDLEKNETAGIPHAKFEHDLDLPEDVDSRYSPEFIAKKREMVERLRKELG
jgi:hypothetical protein